MTSFKLLQVCLTTDAEDAGVELHKAVLDAGVVMVALDIFLGVKIQILGLSAIFVHMKVILFWGIVLLFLCKILGVDLPNRLLRVVFKLFVAV